MSKRLPGNIVDDEGRDHWLLRLRFEGRPYSSLLGALNHYATTLCGSHHGA